MPAPLPLFVAATSLAGYLYLRNNVAVPQRYKLMPGQIPENVVHEDYYFYSRLTIWTPGVFPPISMTSWRPIVIEAPPADTEGQPSDSQTTI